nr:caspase recruitment domain-containing protein 19 isoform X2 [Neomonachus schauinslandi]
MTEQTYCDRLVQDTPFLMGQGSLSEQQVDRIVLQLNRYYPQILSNKDAEKFRNPKASLRVRLSDLLGHLQRSGERDCREFYRALYIHAQLLHSRLPSRLGPQNSDCTELDSGTVGRELSDRGNRLRDPHPIPPRVPSLPQGLLLSKSGLVLASHCTGPRVLAGAPRPPGSASHLLTYPLSPQGPWPSWPASAWPRGWRSSFTAALQTPRCCRGPGVSWASPPSLSTGTSAASCWPSSQTTWEGSDAPARPPGGLPLLF